MIEPLKGRLKKLFNEKIPKDGEVFFVLNGNPGQALVITDKRIAILKTGFWTKEFNSFPLNKFLSMNLLCRLEQFEDYGQFPFKGGNILRIEHPSSDICDFVPKIGAVIRDKSISGEKTEEEIRELVDDYFMNSKFHSFLFKEGRPIGDEIASISFPILFASKVKEAYSYIQTKVEDNQVEKTFLAIKREIEKMKKEEEKKREKKSIFLKHLNISEIPLSIEKKVDELFERLPSGFALCFSGSMGLGKTYQALRIFKNEPGIKYIINPGDSWGYYSPIPSLLFFDKAQRIPKREQEGISGIVDRGKIKIILATTDAGKLLPILRKESIFVNFQPYSLDEMKEILRRICSKNDEFDFLIEMNEEEIFNILKLSKGNPGELIRILKLVKGLGIEKTLEVLGISISDEQINLDTVKSMSPFEFQKWVIKTLGGKESSSKVGDMGIDGIIEGSNFWHQEGIIQVKQFENIGRNVVDNFETAMRRAKYKKGYIVAFSFSKGAYEEVARLKNEVILHIELIKVEDLLYEKKPIS